VNTAPVTSLTSYLTTSRFGSTPAWGVGDTGWMGGSSQTLNARRDLAGAVMRSQLTSEAASVKQGARNATHTVTVIQDAVDNLEAISDALDEMKTLVDDAARGALWETEEVAAQTRIDDLLVEIDRRANLTTDRAANLLAAGAGNITVTLGRGSASADQTIQVPTFDMTTQGLALGASLQLKGANTATIRSPPKVFSGANTASQIDAAIVAVDNARGDITAVLPRMNAAIQATSSSSEILSDASAAITDIADAEAVADSVQRGLLGSTGMGLTFQADAFSRKALDLLGVPVTTPRSETVLPWHTTSLV